MAVGLAFVLLVGTGTVSSARARSSPLPLDAVDLVFVRGGTAAGMFALDLETGAERRLATVGGSPRWSPDGRRIVFDRLKDRDNGLSASRLWVSEWDGTRPRRIGPDAPASGPSWSPDGKRIAYSALVGINVMNADGSADGPVFLDAGLMGSVDWSPDGAWLVVAGNDGLHRVRPDGSQSLRLTRGVFDGSPRWSPDGKHIAFVRSDIRAGTSEIWVQPVNGGTPTRLTRSSVDTGPTWSPDAGRIAFVRGDSFASETSDIFIVRASGGQPTRVTRTAAAEWSPDWRVIRSALPRPSPSPAATATVPALVNRRLTLAMLEGVFRAAGLRFTLGSDRRDPYARWIVVSQAPVAGTKVAPGSTVQLAVLDTSDPFAGRPFERRVWQSNPSCSHDNPRARMVEHLITHRLLRGTSRANVVELLGSGDVSGSAITYPLGEWSGFRIDCDYLRVEFDDRDLLIRAYHFQS